MKRLSHKWFDEPIELSREEHYHLIIEDPKRYRDFLLELREVTNGTPSEMFRYYDDEKECSFSKDIYLIENPLDIPFDEKKLNLTIQKDLSSKISYHEKEEYLLLIQKINEYIENISNDYPLFLDFDHDMPLLNFLKAFSLQYSGDEEDYLSYLVHKLRILSQVFSYKIFIIQNIHDYLTQDEIILLEQEMLSLEIIGIFISNHVSKTHFSNEIQFILDEDLAVIRVDCKNQKN